MAKRHSFPATRRVMGTSFVPHSSFSKAIVRSFLQATHPPSWATADRLALPTASREVTLAISVGLVCL